VLQVREEGCPACGGPGRDRRYRIESFDLFRCRLCSTEYLVQSPDRAPVETTYWDGYKFELYADEVVQSEYEARYESIVGEMVDRFGRVESVLDIGCGIGNFVDWAQRRGLRALGSDIDGEAVDTARGRGLEAYHASELADRVPEGSVDMLTLWDVIEHVHDPRALLEESLRYLRPGGLVVMETPDVRFMLRPLVIGLRKVVEPIRWSDMLYYSAHQVYFSARGLSTLMARCGLDVVHEHGMRSPSTKMAHLLEHWASKGAGAGRLGPALFTPLDRTMRAVGMTNKLIMAGRVPTD
jgi:2-polyprenyl-3-methyl-5-hydroxy-6-metoxy-1,4-benzoquinol methylase